MRRPSYASPVTRVVRNAAAVRGHRWRIANGALNQSNAGHACTGHACVTPTLICSALVASCREPCWLLSSNNNNGTLSYDTLSCVTH